MDSRINRAIKLRKKGDLEGAVRVMNQVLADQPDNAHAHHLTGVMLAASESFERAESHLSRAVELEPESSEFWFSLSNVLKRLSRLDEAARALDTALEYSPQEVKIQVNRAVLATRMGDYATALRLSSKAVELAPAEKRVWLLHMSVLTHCRRFDEGESVANAAKERFPRDAEILHMHGNHLTAAQSYHRALESYRAAIELSPESVRFLNSIGTCYSQMREGLEAIRYHRRALQLEPESIDTLHHLGVASLQAGFPSDAVAHLRRVLDTGSASGATYKALMLSLQYLDGVTEEEIFDVHVEWGEKHARPFYPDKPPLLDPGVREGAGTIRVGFVSPDLHDHSVARFVKPLVRHLPMDGFEVTFYSDYGNESEHAHRLEAMGGRWMRCRNLTDAKLDERIREDRIDVLIDLAGHTAFNRLLVFARKPAPIQISWLGYPNTTGLETVDYRLTDAIADPPGEADRFSTETLIRLPDGFHCFEPPMDLPEPEPPPSAINGYLTFGSFNNQAKISSLTLERWALLLREIPNSRLLLKTRQLDRPEARRIVTRAFEQRGVDPSRLELTGHLESKGAHLQAYSRIDVALDTFPYNGTTTTCEALWLGVPVLTIKGNSQRARTAASLLTNAGWVAWVAENEQEWLALARHYAENLDELEQIRRDLRSTLRNSSLGDGRAFASKFFRTIRDLVRDHR